MDIAVVVLTRNEERHITRCLESVRAIAKEIFIVDCFSDDKTAELAKAQGAQVFEHEWPGIHALQMNWALEHLPITAKWVLRLDADEYLEPALVEEIKAKLDTLPDEVTGVRLLLGRCFMGRKILHGGTNKIRLLRLFRTGVARCEQKLMDEHIDLARGTVIDFTHRFWDDNRNDLSWWTAKHDGYAFREAVDLLLAKDGLGKKRFYRRLPLFWRAFAYFLYRYFLRLGFLDGAEGFLWHFLQGWWYRTLVDAKVLELQRAIAPRLAEGATPREALRDLLAQRGMQLPDE